MAGRHPYALRKANLHSQYLSLIGTELEDVLKNRKRCKKLGLQEVFISQL